MESDENAQCATLAYQICGIWMNDPMIDPTVAALLVTHRVFQTIMESRQKTPHAASKGSSRIVNRAYTEYFLWPPPSLPKEYF